ncbi:MAG: DNA methyltransferase [Candidatus Hodarchaeota archaeon]
MLNIETRNYFKFITKPSSLTEIVSVLDLDHQDDQIDILWDLIRKNNLECYKLMGKEGKETWEIFYLDLETPILFKPLTTDIISFNAFRGFNFITNIIKSRLLTFYSQEIETMLIKININEKEPYTTFKLENQDNLISFKTGKTKIEKSISLDQFMDYTAPSKKRSIESNKIFLKKGKKRKPFGQRNLKNRLNQLTGREWVRFSKSWYIHRPPSRKKEEILHPAKFPETMIRQFITFFTKSGEVVLDPFLGSGSTLVAAKQGNRSGIGIELSEFYAKISRKRLKKIGNLNYPPLYQRNSSCYWEVICGDSMNLLDYWEELERPKIDFCITSPPYWSQLERNSIRQKDRKDKGLDTRYSEDDPRDLGNLKDYQMFLDQQRKIFGLVYKILKKDGYLVVITNNVFANGRIYPLAYDTATSLTLDKDHPWVLKDERIWLQDDKALIALGVNSAWVGNRCHQFCHILRKENHEH